jgi:hypothetical protein
MAEAFIQHERACYPATSAAVRAYGYNDDGDKPISVWSHDWLATGGQFGGLGVFGGNKMSGDQAACISWRLDHKNSRGKYVYLRKYMHDGHTAAGDTDKLDPAYLTNLTQFALDCMNGPAGFWGGVRARTGTWPILAAGTTGWSTTRTLKRRGKRPLVHP